MQISTATNAAPTAPIAPGTTLGRIQIGMRKSEGMGAMFPIYAPITAGKTVLSGIQDPREGANALIQDHWSNPTNVRVSGVVSFIRNGDAYDAVQLLMPPVSGGSDTPEAIWMLPGNGKVEFDERFDVGATWQVSGYGFDYGVLG